MGDLGFQPDYWQWLVLGIALVILEALVPGAIFLWMGISALILGGVVGIYPTMPLAAQIILFAVLSVATVFAWRRYHESHPTESDRPLLNRRGEQYVGRYFALAEPIVNGQGKLQVDDSTWKITGADCDAGSKVKVTGVDGVVLEVELAAPAGDSSPDTT